MNKITATILITLAGILYATYPYPIPYYDEEFLLYPFLNYDQHIEWKRAREGRLYNGSFIQTSHGSQTTWLLMHSEEAVVNQDLGSDFTFRLRYRDLRSRHISYSPSSFTLGLGYKAGDYFTLYAETDLSDLKQEADIKPGILFSFQTVYAYFGVVFEDFLFDLKNTGDGWNNRLPLIFTTDARFYFGRLYLFFSGNYGTGIDRTWDQGPYTDILRHSRKSVSAHGRAEYELTGSIKIYSELFYDRFSESKQFKDSTLQVSSYSFKARLLNLKTGKLFAPGEKHRIDAGISYALALHEMDVIKGTRKDYTINYPALLPYIIYYYDINRQFTAELGYLTSMTLKDYDSNYYSSREKDPQPYWDKHLVKLGFEYRFSPAASLYISAGQLVNTNVFGGGNVRLNVLF